jgi:hypothetical protein
MWVSLTTTLRWWLQKKSTKRGFSHAIRSILIVLRIGNKKILVFLSIQNFWALHLVLFFKYTCFCFSIKNSFGGGKGFFVFTMAVIGVNVIKD